MSVETSTAKMVTFTDGVSVTEEQFSTTLELLRKFEDPKTSSVKASAIFSSLHYRCTCPYSHYSELMVNPFFDAPTFLKNLGLIDENNEPPDYVKKIVSHVCTNTDAFPFVKLLSEKEIEKITKSIKV